MIAVVELSLSSWFVAGIVPGVERQPLKKLRTDENALLTLLNRWRDEAVRSGHKISLTDPDCRSMATSGRGSGVVGYNVQVAVTTEHHLISAHEVTNSGTDRAQLANMGCQAKQVLGVDKLEGRRRPRVLQLRRGERLQTAGGQIGRLSEQRAIMP